MTEHGSEVTKVDVALPFVVAVGLLLGGALLGEMVRRQVKEFYERWLTNSSTPRDHLPYEFQPPVIAWMALWVIDAAQSLGIVVAPLMGVLLLHHDLGAAATVAYAAVAVAAAFSIFFFLTADHPDKYLERFVWKFSPLALIGMALNVVFGVIAVLTTD